MAALGVGAGADDDAGLLWWVGEFAGAGDDPVGFLGEELHFAWCEGQAGVGGELARVVDVGVPGGLVLVVRVFESWDVEDAGEGRQVDVCLVEEFRGGQSAACWRGGGVPGGLVVGDVDGRVLDIV